LNQAVNRVDLAAKVVARVTNPTTLSVLVLLLLGFTKSDTLIDAVRWTSIILLFFAFIPLIYVLLRTSKTGARPRSVNELTTFLKHHPSDILFLGLVLGTACLIALRLLNGPEILFYMIIALLAGSVITSIFNLWYRVSFHLTGITILIIVAAHAWGQGYLALLCTTPIIAWAKYHLKHHTIPQLIIGFTVGITVSIIVLQFV
jgi:hypothetical protein